VKQYLRAFLGLCVLVALLRVRFAFALLAALAVIAIVAWRAAGAGAGIRVARRAPARAFIGDELAVELTIVNPGRRRAGWAYIADDVPQSLRGPGQQPRFVMSLAGREARTVGYRIVARRRGYHELGPATGTSGDTFGMRQVEIAGGASDRVIVYPKIVPIRRMALITRAAVPAIAARQALMEDPSRIRGMRGYQPGDSMRTIHWPASAAAGQLLTKQIDPSTARTTVVALDLIQRDFRAGSRSSGPELAVTAAASLLVHIINEEGLEAGLLAYGHDPLSGVTGLADHPVRGERAHLMAMLDHLARISVAREGSFVDAVRTASPGWPWAASVVVVTGAVGEQLALGLIQLKRRGFAPTVLAVQAGERTGRGDEILASQGVPVHRIDRQSDLGGGAG
jgi:uncharacterized protein (DUF58 family)